MHARSNSDIICSLALTVTPVTMFSPYVTSIFWKNGSHFPFSGFGSQGSQGSGAAGGAKTIFVFRMVAATYNKRQNTEFREPSLNKFLVMEQLQGFEVEGCQIVVITTKRGPFMQIQGKNQTLEKRSKQVML